MPLAEHIGHCLVVYLILGCLVFAKNFDEPIEL